MEIIRYNPDEHKQTIKDMLVGEPHFQETFDESTGDECQIHIALLERKPVGFLCMSPLRRVGYVTIYVDKAHRRQGIGSALAKKAHEILLAADTVEQSMGECIMGDKETVQFLYKHGYYISFSSHYMEREGDPLPVGDIEVRQYEDSDFDAWIRILNVAFFQMRERVGIKPSYFSMPNDEDREAFLKNRHNWYVMLAEGEIVAVGIIEGNELSIVAVRPSFHGKGYGKDFIAWLVNRIMEQGHKTVSLWCVNGNKARNLYDKLGFEAKEHYGFVTRYYRPDSRMSAPPADWMSI